MAESETISPDLTVEELTADLREGGDVSVKTEGGEFTISVFPTDDVDETEFLLSQPESAKRLRDALARDRSENISFESLADLKDAVGN